MSFILYERIKLLSQAPEKHAIEVPTATSAVILYTIISNTNMGFLRSHIT